MPLVGSVAAGQPILAEENIEEYVDVPAAAGGEDGDFVLRVRGESMIDAGILEGDFVVVRPQDVAVDGEIVVALVGEESEATVKRFFHEADHVRLQPENDNHGADPLEGRARAREGRRPVPERAMSITLTRDIAQPSLLDAAPRRGETLEDVISGAWEGLAAHDVVSCPVCHGEMVPRYGSGGTTVGGRCQDCGTTLS